MNLKKVVNRLGGDFEHLTGEYGKIAGTLGNLGLSQYESRAYLALVALGSSTANFVAEAAQIPRTSAYKVMESLEKKGFARKLPGRPVSFLAKPFFSSDSITLYADVLGICAASATKLAVDDPNATSAR